MKKEDPRALRTQEMLKEAVLTLLENGVTTNQLTVQQVTKQARLNRTTFYLHFNDIYDLITQMTATILQDLTIHIEELIQVQHVDEEKRLVHFLDYLYMKRHHLLLLFQLEQFEQHMFQLIKQLIETRRSAIPTMTPKMRVHVDIKTASIVGVIMWWLKNGLHLSSDYISEQIHFMYRSS